MSVERIIRLTISLSIIGVLIYLGFRGCTRTEEEQAFLNEMQKDGPVQEAFNVEFVFSEMAEIQARLTAPHVIEKIEDKENVSYFDRGLRITFYNEEGKVKSDLRAEKGKFFQMFGKGEVWDNVRVVNEKGDKINTEKLYYDKKADRIHTSRKHVTIETATDIYRGDSLEANLDFSKYKIWSFSGAVTLTENE